MEATDVPGGSEDAAGAGEAAASAVEAVAAADDGAAAGAEHTASSAEGGRPLAWAFATAIGSRVLIFAVAFAAAALIGIGGLPVGWRFPLRAEVFSGWLGSLFNPWAHWDGVWYIKIATSGYAEADGSTAFFPLFPMLLRYVGVLLDGNLLITGIVISLLCYAGCVWLLYRLVRRDFDEKIAARAVIYLAIGPLSFFLQAVYTESLVPAPLARLLRVRPRGPLAARGRHGPARDAHPQHRRAPAHPDGLLLLQAARLGLQEDRLPRGQPAHGRRGSPRLDDVPRARLRQAARLLVGAGAVGARHRRPELHGDAGGGGHGVGAAQGASRPSTTAGSGRRRGPDPSTAIWPPTSSTCCSSSPPRCCCGTGRGGCPAPTPGTRWRRWRTRSSSPASTCR